MSEFKKYFERSLNEEPKRKDQFLAWKQLNDAKALIKKAASNMSRWEDCPKKLKKQLEKFRADAVNMYQETSDAITGQKNFKTNR